jgi:hypothetical protein
MRIGDLAVLLDARPAHLAVFLRDTPVTGLTGLSGRIRRDVMGSTFSEMPDKPRDEVLTPDVAVNDETGRLPVLKARELRRLLDLHDPETELFIDGDPVDGLDERRGRISMRNGRPSFRSDPVGGRDVVLTFTRWTELSDGTRHLVAF